MARKSYGTREHSVGNGPGWWRGRPRARLRPVAVVTAGVVAGLTFAVTGAAHASGGGPAEPVAAPAGDAGVLVVPHNAHREWAVHSPVFGKVVYAFATIERWPGGRKHLHACDYKDDDGIGLAIQIDPSGGGPPDTIIYYDRDGVGPDCLHHDIRYPVRKWRFVSVYQDGRPHVVDHPWQIYPLPHPDY